MNTPLKKTLTSINENFLEPRSVIVLTGGIGTGKTTFLNHLNKQFRLLYFSQPMFSIQEVFQAIREKLAIPSDSADTHALGNIIAKHLVGLSEKKQNHTLTFDEAQSCSKKMLLGLRLLQETVALSGGKLPVLLSGHRELVFKILKLDFKPAMGNNLFFYKIENFNFQDMQSMIDYRLKIAGSSLVNIFSSRAIEEVYKQSNGVPRLVNNICDLSLMTSFGKEQNIISSGTILNVAKNIFNLHEKLPVSPSTIPVMKTTESKKIIQKSLQPDHKISGNNDDEGMEKRKFSFGLVKIIALVLFVLLLKGLSSQFLHKRTLGENDIENLSPVYEIAENLPIKKDVTMGLGYTPVKNYISLRNNTGEKDMSPALKLDDGKEKLPMVYLPHGEDLSSGPVADKDDMSSEMVLSDRQVSLPLNTAYLKPIQAIEDNDIEKEYTPEIARNKQYNQNQNTQNKTIQEQKKTLTTKKRSTKKIAAPGLKTLKSDKLKDQPRPQFNKALSKAIQKNDIALVKLLLARGTGPDSTDEKGSPLLLKAAEQGNLEIINALLKKGADINAKDRDGETSLMKAAWMGSSNVVLLLLKHHTDINGQNLDGYSALFYGAINGHDNIVKILLDHRADTNLTDINKKTPLMAAAWNGHINIVNLLLEHNSNVNKKDKNSWTALMFAAFQGHEAIFKRLIAVGSNISLKNSEGYTSLNLAVSQGHNELIHHVSN